MGASHFIGLRTVGLRGGWGPQRWPKSAHSPVLVPCAAAALAGTRERGYSGKKPMQWPKVPDGDAPMPREVNSPRRVPKPCFFVFKGQILRLQTWSCFRSLDEHRALLNKPPVLRLRVPSCWEAASLLAVVPGRTRLLPGPSRGLSGTGCRVSGCPGALRCEGARVAGGYRCCCWIQRPLKNTDVDVLNMQRRGFTAELVLKK